MPAANIKIKLVTVQRLLPVNSMALVGCTLCVQCVETHGNPWLCTLREMQTFPLPSCTTATFELLPFDPDEPAEQPFHDL